MNYIVFESLEDTVIPTVKLVTKSKNKAIHLMKKIIEKDEKDLGYKYCMEEGGNNKYTILTYECDLSKYWIEEHKTGEVHEE